MKTREHSKDADVKADLWWWAEQATKASADPTANRTPLSARQIRSGLTTVQAGRVRGKRTHLILVNNEDLHSRTRTPEGRWIIHHRAHLFGAQAKHRRLVGVVYWAAVITAVTCSLGFMGVAGNGTKLLTIVVAVLACIASIGIGRYRFAERRDTLVAADVAATKAVGLPAALKALECSSDQQLYKTAAHEWWQHRNPVGLDNRISRLQGKFNVQRRT